MPGAFGLLFLLLLGACGAARADACTATLTDLNFGSVSPITGSDVYASASGNVTCVWSLLSPTPPFILLLPKAVVCINISLGSNSTSSSPRTLGNGASRMEYNLYRDATYAPAAIWGSPALAGTPTPLTLVIPAPNLLTGGTFAQPFTVYGKIAAGGSLAAVPTSGNANTTYSSSFTGAATISYAFFNLFQPACTSGASGSFSFQASATAINDCTISATPVNFGNSGVLTSTVRATGTLSVRCVNNNAYQIALNGGTVAGAVAARKMKPASGSARIAYRLSQSLDGAVWGDGTGGTTVYSGTGTGNALGITVFGAVPAQTTPAPGDYSDTVTATIYF
ncbi:MAG: spore coat U domain-containing protein [Pseudomonadota bacterium]